MIIPPTAALAVAVAMALKRFEKKSEKEERIAALIRKVKNECEK